MEKALTALLAVILCLVRGGIPMDKEIRMEPEGTETGTEWTETQKKLELTETEIALLVSTGPNEQRIRDGELTDTELRELEVIRYTVRRMEELYPGEIIEYREMNPGARGGTGISFTAWERKAGPDRTFLVFTAVGGTPEKPEYFCADNLAGQLLRPQLENTVGDILAEAGLNLHGFEADFPYLAGEDFDRSRTVEQLLEEGKCPPCTVRVEIRAGGMDPAAFDACVKKLEELFRARGLQGSVLVLGYDTAGDDPLPGGLDSALYSAQILL